MYIAKPGSGIVLELWVLVCENLGHLVSDYSTFVFNYTTFVRVPNQVPKKYQSSSRLVGKSPDLSFLNLTEVVLI